MTDTSNDQPPAESAEPGEVRPTGRPNARLGQTVADMARSLVVVLVVVGAILLVTWRPQPDAVRTIDPTSELIAARATAGFAVLYPADLGSDWRPTSARWDLPESASPEPAWHVGFVTPGEAYVQLGQSVTTNPEYLVDQTGRGQPQPGNDGPWQRYESGGSGTDVTRSLVQVVNGVTIVVSGTLQWAELLLFADSLSPTATPEVAESNIDGDSDGQS